MNGCDYLLTYSIDGLYMAELCRPEDIARHITEAGYTYERNFRVYEFVSGRPSILYPQYTPDLHQLELRTMDGESVLIIDIE